MSLGLEAAYGNEGLYARLRQQVMDQVAEQQRKTQNDLQLRSADRADRALNQQDELTRLKIKELSDNKAATEADQQFKIGTTLNNSIPSGTVLPVDSPSLKPLQAVGAVKEQAPTLPSTAYVGMQTPPQAGAAIAGRLVSRTSNPGNPRQFVKLPSQAENVAASTQDLRQQEAERRLEESTNRAAEAWTRLQQGQQTASALAAFHQSQLELQQAKLAAEQAKAAAAAARTPQPQYFNDATGKTHAVIFDKGTLTEIPLPAGYTPTKAAPPSIFDKVSHWFNGGTADATADLTDPNWGK